MRLLLTKGTLGLAVALVASIGLHVGEAQAAVASGPYRTDHQAERYIEHQRGGQAYCLNGYYSRHEQRTGRHFRQRADERYRSFVCTWGKGAGPTVRLYVQTRWGPWVIIPDR